MSTILKLKNLWELDEDGLDELTIMKLNKQRRFVLLIFIVTVINGLLLPVFLIFLLQVSN